MSSNLKFKQVGLHLQMKGDLSLQFENVEKCIHQYTGGKWYDPQKKDPQIDIIRKRTYYTDDGQMITQPGYVRIVLKNYFQYMPKYVSLEEFCTEVRNISM